MKLGWGGAILSGDPLAGRAIIFFVGTLYSGTREISLSGSTTKTAIFTGQQLLGNQAEPVNVYYLLKINRGSVISNANSTVSAKAHSHRVKVKAVKEISEKHQRNVLLVLMLSHGVNGHLIYGNVNIHEILQKLLMMLIQINEFCFKKSAP